MNDQAYKLRRQMEMMQCNQAKTIAFVSGKGGVGKSNAALNFSLALLKSGYRVLLIDLDVGMGNIEVLLGKQSRQTIADMFQTGSKMVDLIEEGPLNLKFIAGGTGLTAIFHADATMLESFFVQFAQVSSNFDFIVLDMGAGVSRESMQFILAADECFVITTPEPTAIMDAYSMVKHIVKSQADMSIYMVMNQVESPYSGKKASIHFKEIVKKFLGADVLLLGTLPRDPFVYKAVMCQTPYMLLNDRAAISKAMQTLTAAYLSERGVQTVHQSGFIEKLKKWMRKR